MYNISTENTFYKLGIKLGLLLSGILKIRNENSLFFFFPHFHVGGAEKVHADIVKCFASESPWVFFTHQSKDNRFKPLFGTNARLVSLWWLLKYTLPLSVGYIAGTINRHRNAVVFGCSSRFFYKMIPHLNPGVRRIDLLHAFGGGGEDFSLPVVPFLDARVVINRKTSEDFQRQYAAHGLDPKFLDNIVLIENRIGIPVSYPQKASSRLQVLYVGRGSEEKRVHIAGRVATLARARGIAADFRFAGDVAGAVLPEDRENCIFLGEIQDPAELGRIYRAADILLLCSSREGFPIVIMEAMANGVVPVSTSVGGIPEHVMDGVNGVLVTEIGEDQIAGKMSDILQLFSQDAAAMQKMSHAAYEYARGQFAGNDFCKKYRELFFGEVAKGDR